MICFIAKPNIFIALIWFPCIILNADDTLNNLISTNAANMSANASGLAQELLDRAAGDDALDASMGVAFTNIAANTSGLAQELLDRAAGDDVLDASMGVAFMNIAGNASDLAQEIVDRGAADTLLDASMDVVFANVAGNDDRLVAIEASLNEFYGVTGDSTATVIDTLAELKSKIEENPISILDMDRTSET